MHLSLSLSLSNPTSTPGLTPASQRFSGRHARHANPYPAPCSKLPSHARNDVRRPLAVTRDRSLPYTSTIGRQAHRQWYCRAPGGVAGPKRTSLFHCEWTSHAPGGVAVLPRASFLPITSFLPSASLLPGAWRRRQSPLQRVCSSVAAIFLIVASVFEEAPVRSPKRAGSVIERRGLNPRPRRSTSFTRHCSPVRVWGVRCVR